MWYKFSQTEQLDPNKPGQTIPSGGQLEINVTSGDLNMGPNDPPKIVNVTTDSGQQQSIILVHGILSPDGKANLYFPDESGQMHSGSPEEFEQYKSTKGWTGLKYVCCYGGKIIQSEGGAGDVLINATGTVNAGSTRMPDGTEKLIFTQ